MPLARFILVSMLGGTLVLAALEGVLRWQRPLIFGGAYYKENGVIRHGKAPGRNSQGYTDVEHAIPKPGGAFRIVGLGDSMSDTPPGLPEKNHHHQTQLRLQREHKKPRVEVINNALGGMSPNEMLDILRGHSLLYQPDRVAFNLFVGGAIQGFDPGKSWDVINGQIVRVRTDRMTIHVQEYVELLHQRVLQCRLHSMGSNLATRKDDRTNEQRLQDLEDRLRTEGKAYYLPLVPSDAESGAFGHEHYVDLEAERSAIYLRAQPESMVRRYERIFQQIDEMRDVAQAAGAAFHVILFPDEFQVNPVLRGRVYRKYGMQEASLDIEQPQRRILEHCRTVGIPCLDLLPAFVAHPDPASLFAVRDTHMNARGHELAGTLIARWLVEEGLVP